MAHTLIDISVQVLDSLGRDAISSLDDESIEAQTIATHWRIVLDRCLSRTTWPFATKTVELSRLEEPPENPRWTYAFAIPSDLLIFHQIVDVGGRGVGAETWTREGSLILSDRDRLFLRYGRTFEQAEFVLLPVSFQQYYAASLALQITPKLTASNADVQRADALVQRTYSAALTDACRMSAPTELFGMGSWIAARGSR